MHLVNNIDLELASSRCKTHVLSQLAHLVYAVIARSINLQDIKTDSLGNLATRVTDSTRCDGWSVNAIESLRQNSRGRSFPGSAGTNEQVGVCQAIPLDSISQCLDYVILAQNIVERLGAIFTRKDLITHKCNVSPRHYEQSNKYVIEPPFSGSKRPPISARSLARQSLASVALLRLVLSNNKS